MCEPGEETIEQEQQKQRDDRPVEQVLRIAHIKDDRLRRRQQGHAEQRPHAPPFARPDIEEGQKKDAEHDRRHPRILRFTAEREGIHAEGGGDPLPSLETHRDGVDMPDDDRHAAHIPREIGDEHARTRKHIVPPNEIGDEQGQPALDHVAEQRQPADRQPELAAHVHRARVAAAHAAHVLVFDLGDEQREIETADEVGDDRHHDKPIPNVRKGDDRHTSASSPRVLARMRMGVPEKSKARRSTFSR